MRNVELKVRCDDLDAVRDRARRLGATSRGILLQRDIYYTAPRGRLKLRVSGDLPAELIAYERPDRAGERVSEYGIATIADAAGLDAVLARVLPRRGVVEKRRELWIWGRTRVHLDDVAGLGRFVELETIVDASGEVTARAEFEHVARELGLLDGRPVAGSYIDLLAAEASAGPAAGG